MISARTVRKKIAAEVAEDGAGVRIRRGIGQTSLPNLDPFLLVDHFGTDNPDDYIAGFPDHPHRGFVTVTYMIEGHMRHRDSMGNQGDLGPGDVQWMKAASGIIHSEMPQQKDGAMRGFQLWLNLPAHDKMSSPAYQEFKADKIPIYAFAGGNAHVISGALYGVTGPVVDTNTNSVLLHVDLEAHAKFETPIDPTAAVALYVFEGGVQVDDVSVATHEVAQLDDGAGVCITAGSEGARLLLMAGVPIGEAIVQRGPFVMNTTDEIRQAFDDYRNGRLVRERADVIA